MRNNGFRKDPGKSRNDIAKEKRSEFAGYTFTVLSTNDKGYSSPEDTKGHKKVAFVTGIAVSPDGKEEIRVSFDIADSRARSLDYVGGVDPVKKEGEEYIVDTTGLLLSCDGESYVFTKAA